MGFKSVMGKVGKVALKVAPYALMATGVGIPAGMALAAASNIADRKLSGQSWKSSLIGGGIAGGLYGVGAGALKGIGPSSGTLAKLGSGAAGKVAGTGATGKLGAALGNLGMSALESKISGGPSQSQYDGSDYSAGNIAQDRNGPMKGIGPREMRSRTPDFAAIMNAGRQNAYANQPFRSGYDILTPGVAETTNPDGTVASPAIGPTSVRMPPIYPNIPSARQRRRVGQGY